MLILQFKTHLQQTSSYNILIFHQCHSQPPSITPLNADYLYLTASETSYKLYTLLYTHFLPFKICNSICLHIAMNPKGNELCDFIIGIYKRNWQLWRWGEEMRVQRMIEVFQSTDLGDLVEGQCRQWVEMRSYLVVAVYGTFI